MQDRPLADAGGKGLFTKEIEEALLAGSIDLAVHSSKDLPTVLPPGLVLAGFPAARGRARRVYQPQGREPARFAAGRDGRHRLAAPAGVGQAAAARSAVVMLRGNVETRLRKLDAGEVDATLLAVAGLKRLGLLSTATAILDRR